MLIVALGCHIIAEGDTRHDPEPEEVPMTTTRKNSFGEFAQISARTMLTVVGDVAAAASVASSAYRRPVG
jgi:hypothetical protein